MPVPAELAQDPAIAGPLGTLAFSVVKPHSPTLALRALRWHRDLERLGVRMPLAVVHDVGLLLGCPNDQLEIGPRAPIDALVGKTGADASLFRKYRAIVEEVAESETAQRARSLRMSDDMVAVVLARVLGSIAHRVSPGPAYPTGVPLDASLVDGIDPQLPALFRGTKR